MVEITLGFVCSLGKNGQDIKLGQTTSFSFHTKKLCSTMVIKGHKSVCYRYTGLLHSNSDSYNLEKLKLNKNDLGKKPQV